MCRVTRAVSAASRDYASASFRVPSAASRDYASEQRRRHVTTHLSSGGVVVVESLEHAKARGAKIYGELTGYAATADGYDVRD